MDLVLSALLRDCGILMYGEIIEWGYIAEETVPLRVHRIFNAIEIHYSWRWCCVLECCSLGHRTEIQRQEYIRSGAVRQMIS